jgi:hypothetical protein
VRIKKPGSDGSQGGKGLLSLPGAIGSMGRADNTRHVDVKSGSLARGKNVCVRLSAIRI